MPTHTANPSEFDYFRRLEPVQAQNGKTTEAELNYFRRGEPAIAMDFTQIAASVAGSSASASATTASIIAPSLLVFGSSASSSSTTGGISPPPTIVAIVPNQPGKLANPNEFNYYIRSEPLGGFQGKAATTDFEYFRRNAPSSALTGVNSLATVAASTTTMTMMLGVVLQATSASVSQTLNTISVRIPLTTNIGAGTSRAGGVILPSLLMNLSLAMNPGSLMISTGLIAANINVTYGLVSTFAISASTSTTSAITPAIGEHLSLSMVTATSFGGRIMVVAVPSILQIYHGTKRYGISLQQPSDKVTILAEDPDLVLLV